MTRLDRAVALGADAERDPEKAGVPVLLRLQPKPEREPTVRVLGLGVVPSHLEPQAALEVTVLVPSRQVAVVSLPAGLERSAPRHLVGLDVEQVGVVAVDPQLEVELDGFRRVVGRS